MKKMPLTRENAKNCCRTCLIKLCLNDFDNENAYAEQNNELNIQNDFINIKENVKLQNLLRKYIDDAGGENKDYVEDFPQNVCTCCYEKLRLFDKFRRKAQYSAKQLHNLLSSAGITTNLEIEYESDSEEDSKEFHNEDIYKLLLKDTLMETESVMLNSTAVDDLTTIKIHDPDPFANAVLQRSKHKKQTKKSEEITESSASELEAAFDSEYYVDEQQEVENESKSSESTERRPMTRSTGAAKATIKITPTKKKRRTKKEMEELRQSQQIKQQEKMKRRNKGTKNSFKCEQCNHSFAHKITLDAHIRKVHEGSKRPFQCDRCEKAYTFIGGLYTHIKEIHETEVRSYACDFPNCDRVYTSSIAMQKHKRLKHIDVNNQKQYVCEQCGSTFNQSGNLKYHRRTKHPTEADLVAREKSKERFECTICQKLFHSRYTLKYHTLQLHTHDMKYECNVCGRRMAKKFMLVQHMLVHSTDKMPCEHCGKLFIRKFELEAHIRAVHMKLKPFECQYCQECFASRKTLRHHEYIHTGEKPYVCDICGQAYRQQTCLKNHRKSHEKTIADNMLTASLNRTLMNTTIPTINAPAATLAMTVTNQAQSFGQ